MMPNKDVVMEEGEVTITSQKPNTRGQNLKGIIEQFRSATPKGRGGFSGMMDKVRSAVPAKKKPFKSGGSVKSKASSRGDGCATKGKTKGRMI
jgi:hypothetical protein